MAHVVFPESEGGRESHPAVFHRSEERVFPRAGVGSRVGDDVDTTANCGKDVRAGIGVDENGFVRAMSFVRSCLEGAFRERWTARGRGEKFYAVDAFVEEGFGGGRCLRWVGDFRSRKLH